MKASELTKLVIFGNVAIYSYFSISQIFIILEKSPTAKILLELNEIDKIPSYPFNVAISLNFSKFHNFMVVSKDPVAKIVLLWLKATEKT